MRTVVGVLRGGPGAEYEHSLKSGAAVLEHIDRELYEPRDIFVDRAGSWHVHGLAVAPQQALFGVDTVFNALHGEYAENGSLQRFLDTFAVPYTGSPARPTSLAYNRHLAKEAVKNSGVRVAHGIVVARPADDIAAVAHTIFRTFPHPARVRPLAGRGSHLAEHFAGLHSGLEKIFAEAPHALVEEHISGRQAGVGVIRGYRNEPVYALVPTPHDLTAEQKAQVAAAAKAVHEALGLGHYSHPEFVVSRRGTYFVGVSTHPPLHAESGIAQALAHVGSSLKEFISHVLRLAHNK